MRKHLIKLEKVISGGQAGVDRAALDVAIELSIPHAGWCPRDRKAEDGIIPSRYQLQETPSDEYFERTKWNVRDSDGTLIIVEAQPVGGTQLTIDKAIELGKPYLIFDLSKKHQINDIVTWIIANNIHILNIAGPRESQAPGIYDVACTELRKLLCHKVARD